MSELTDTFWRWQFSRRIVLDEAERLAPLLAKALDSTLPGRWSVMPRGVNFRVQVEPPDAMAGCELQLQSVLNSILPGAFSVSGNVTVSAEQAAAVRLLFDL